MQATVYANLSNRRLSTTIGGRAVSFPAFVQGDKVRIGMRLADVMLDGEECFEGCGRQVMTAMRG